MDQNQEQNYPEQSAPQPAVPQMNTGLSNNTTNIIVRTLLLIIVLLGILGGVYYAWAKNYILTTSSVKQTSSQTKNTVEVSPVVQPSPSLIKSANVEWESNPKQVPSIGFFYVVDQYYPFGLSYYKKGNENATEIMNANYEPNATYYEVGKVTSEQYKGGTIYLGVVRGLPNSHTYKGVPTADDIVNDLTEVFLFIQMPDKSFVLTNDYDNQYLFCSAVNFSCNKDSLFVTGVNKATGINVDTTVKLDIIGNNGDAAYTDPSGAKLSIDYTTNFFNPSGLYLVKNIAPNTALYSNQNITSNSIKIRSIIAPQYTMKLPTGLAAQVSFSGAYYNDLIYKKGTSEYVPDGSAQIVWTSEDKPQELSQAPKDQGIQVDQTAITYTSEYDGCRGNITLENSSSDDEILDTQNNLIQVGSTDKGDKIYDIKNKDYKIFQQFWFWKVVQNGLDSMSYQDYLNLKPILIVKNALGGYSMVFRQQLVASKCWGEPLIYLYPEKQTNVHVTLSNTISLSESEPAYANGWNVIAYPNGEIYDLSTQRNYPYLYWEGSAPDSMHPVIKDVVAQKDIHNYFDKTLSTLGLNGKEREDFEKYWESKLKGSNYFVISFYDANELNKVAPLKITPQPDSLIRVLMSYEGINKKLDLHTTNQLYITPIRKGFTVVEWGGILHKTNQ